MNFSSSIYWKKIIICQKVYIVRLATTKLVHCSGGTSTRSPISFTDLEKSLKTYTYNFFSENSHMDFTVAARTTSFMCLTIFIRCTSTTKSQFISRRIRTPTRIPMWRTITAGTAAGTTVGTVLLTGQDGTELGNNTTIQIPHTYTCSFILPPVSPLNTLKRPNSAKVLIMKIMRQSTGISLTYPIWYLIFNFVNFIPAFSAATKSWKNIENCFVSRFRPGAPFVFPYWMWLLSAFRLSSHQFTLICHFLRPHSTNLDHLLGELAKVFSLKWIQSQKYKMASTAGSPSNTKPSTVNY